jgi:hypothetical protein
MGQLPASAGTRMREFLQAFTQAFTDEIDATKRDGGCGSPVGSVHCGRQDNPYFVSAFSTSHPDTYLSAAEHWQQC